MSRRPDVEIGCQVPRLQLLPAGRVSSGIDEAVALAESCGLYLFEWQIWCLDQMLSENEDLSWCAQQILLLCPRQNGKNAVLEALELAALYLFDEYRIIHTAHLVTTSTAHMERMKILVGNNPELSAITQFYGGNGKEKMVRLDTGARIEFMTRGQKTQRGPSPERVIFDEALYLTDAQIQAIIPSMSAQSMNEDGGPQFVFTSSAPLATSDVLHRVRNRAFGDGDVRTMFAAEWSCEEGDDIMDRANWRRSNPSMNVLISEEWVEENELTILTPEAFAIERMGVTFPVTSAGTRVAKIPAVHWEATATGALVPATPGRVTLGYGVGIDGLTASISVGVGDLEAPYGELISHGGGVGWLPQELVRLIHKWQPTAVACPPSTPAAAQIPSILTAFRKASPPISADVLHVLSMAEWKVACGGLFTDITEGRFSHPVGQTQLDDAVHEAAERKLGDGFVWWLRGADVPICPLDSLTAARAVLPVEAPKVSTPMFAYTK